MTAIVAKHSVHPGILALFYTHTPLGIPPHESLIFTPYVANRGDFE